VWEIAHSAVEESMSTSETLALLPQANRAGAGHCAQLQISSGVPYVGVSATAEVKTSS